MAANSKPLHKIPARGQTPRKEDSTPRLQRQFALSELVGEETVGPLRFIGHIPREPNKAQYGLIREYALNYIGSHNMNLAIFLH